MGHIYQKLVEKDGDMKLEIAPMSDFDGSVTGHIVFNVAAWFDENPEERIRLGWTKHITHTAKELGIEYDSQTQFTVISQKKIDEYTIEDEIHVLNKSEEQLALEELLDGINNITSGLNFVWG